MIKYLVILLLIAISLTVYAEEPKICMPVEKARIVQEDLIRCKYTKERLDSTSKAFEKCDKRLRANHSRGFWGLAGAFLGLIVGVLIN